MSVQVLSTVPMEASQKEDRHALEAAFQRGEQEVSRQRDGGGRKKAKNENSVSETGKRVSTLRRERTCRLPAHTS